MLSPRSPPYDDRRFAHISFLIQDAYGKSVRAFFLVQDASGKIDHAFFLMQDADEKIVEDRGSVRFTGFGIVDD